MNKESILAKVVAKEECKAFVQRCVSAKVCPDCGGDLAWKERNSFEDELTCKSCEKVWESRFFE